MVRGILILAFLASFNLGCFVIDEIDSGMKTLEAHTPTSAKEEESDTAKAAPAKVDDNFWQNARSIAPGSDKGNVVSCNLRGQVQFMKRDDCINRGGHPK
jgi:hypothetical protein